MKKIWAMGLIGSIGLLGGCGTSGSGSSSSSNPAQTATYIYSAVGDGGSAILAFPPTSSGDLDNQWILGPVGINLPIGSSGASQGSYSLATDSTGTLYVLGQGSVVWVYSASTSYPYLAATSTVVGPERTMKGFGISGSYLVSLATDTSGNLYVGSYNATTDAGTVSVYLASGNGYVTATRTITGSQTGMLQVRDMAADSAGNLYVVAQTSTGHSAVLVYGPGASGNVAPVRTITNATNNFESVTILPNGNAAVTAQPYTASASVSNTIMEFSPSATGAATPVTTITVDASSTGGVTTTIPGVRADSAGYLYVVTQQQSGCDISAISTYSPNASGSATPVRSFNTTTLCGVNGQLALQ